MINNEYSTSDLPQVLENDPLEVIRAHALCEIKNNVLLSRRQKRTAIRDLDSLLDYERRRRQRLMYWQSVDEARERRIRIIERNCEFINRLVLERKNTQLKVAQINAEIINLKAGSIERVLRLKQENPKLKEIGKLKHEFVKLKLRKAIDKYIRAEAERDLEDRVIRRARFQQKVAEEFPDLVEEIMDEYDRESYRSIHEDE
jgi:hypothetical protein